MDQRPSLNAICGAMVGYFTESADVAEAVFFGEAGIGIRERCAVDLLARFRSTFKDSDSDESPGPVKDFFGAALGE